VTATAFDPGFAEGDSAYNALRVGADGRLYFTLCTHRIDTHARVGCFDPAAERIVFVKEIGEAVGEDATSVVPQGKIHVSPVDVDGRLYLATMIGYYDPDLRGRRGYPGFHVLALDMRTGAWTDLVRGPEGEGLITGILDPARLVFSGLTYPSGLFCRYDVRAGTLSVSPRPCADPPLPSRIHGRPLYPICRALGLDMDGAVYGSCQDGSIWRCESGGEPRALRGLNVGQGAVPPVDRAGRAAGFWRSVVWRADEECFYGIHGGTHSLFRFDPRTRRIDPLSRLGVAASHGAGHDVFRAQLGLTCGPGRVLYHIAHGPPPRLHGRDTPRTAAYLVSYDLGRGEFREHGPIRTEAGERVLFAESLCAGPRGELYAMGWVEVTGEDLPRYRRLRAQASNGECHGEVYRMLLLRLRIDDLVGDAS
jgi:hypothetical protein